MKNTLDLITPLTRNMTLLAIAAVAFSLRLFSVVRYESVIHEFDPWFNYRATEYLTEKGWRAFLNWWDEKAWYPLGRAVGVTVYPGMMLTAHFANYMVNGVFKAQVKLRDICVLMAPAFSGATAVAAYLVAKEVKDELAGLVAAAFMAVVPGYISRSVAGSYDYEGIAITLLMAMFWLWLRAIRSGSVRTAVGCAAVYYYMAGSWGGYVFPINLIPLHVVALLATGKYTPQLYTAYSTFYTLATLSSLTIPFIAYQPVSTSEHMAAMGAFCLLQLVHIVEQVRLLMVDPSRDASGEQCGDTAASGEQCGDTAEFKRFRRYVIAAIATLLVSAFLVLAMRGKIAPFAGRFYSLYDTSYARKHIPIIASVSEHQPTAFGSFFFDMHVLLVLAPVGLAYCAMRFEAAHLFCLLYAVSSSYFAGVMVRLMLTMAPMWCVASAVAVSWVLDVHAASRDWSVKLAIAVPMVYVLMLFVWHCTWITSNAYSSPSIILTTQDPKTGSTKVIDDFREAYSWLRHNTAPDAKVLAWWDYGYQMAGMADRTTIVDNNTWNNTHIATVGLALASDEPRAYRLLRELDVDYVLVLFGGVSGYSGDDLNKFLWMIRIAQGVFPDAIREADFYTATGDFRVDARASESMRRSIMWRMSFYRYAEVMGAQAVDRARGASMAGVNPKLTCLTEAYSTENYIVRIFKVKGGDSLGRRHWSSLV